MIRRACGASLSRHAGSSDSRRSSQRFKDLVRKPIRPPLMRRLRRHHLEPRDPEGPRGKTGSRLKIRRLALHDKKCLLEHILRGGKIRQQREDEAF